MRAIHHSDQPPAVTGTLPVISSPSLAEFASCDVSGWSGVGGIQFTGQLTPDSAQGQQEGCLRESARLSQAAIPTREGWRCKSPRRNHRQNLANEVSLRARNATNPQPGAQFCCQGTLTPDWRKKKRREGDREKEEKRE